MYSSYHENLLSSGNYQSFYNGAGEVLALPTVTPIHTNNGLTYYQDCYGQFVVNEDLFQLAPIAATLPFPFTPCFTLPFLFDYNYFNSNLYPKLNPGESTILAEFCKIYMIHYEIRAGGMVFEGYLRHQLGDDTVTLDDLLNYYPDQWEDYGPFETANLIDPGYEAFIVKNIKSEELSVVQRSRYTTLLPSEEVISIPGFPPHTISFKHNSTGIIIELTP